MDDDGAPSPVSTRLRRSTPSHDAYTVRVCDRRVTALSTARPADARRWVATTRWLHAALHLRGRLVVGLGVQWTPTGRPLGGAPQVPDTLQLCVGHRCLVFHLARADAVPEMLRRFLADPRVTFVGVGSAYDRRMLWAHCGLHVARARELRAVAGMGNASMEEMADRFLGYHGIHKPKDVAMSAWNAPRLSRRQVQYACVDAYLAFRLGLRLCGPAAPPLLLRTPRPPPPAAVRTAPLVLRAPAINRPVPPLLLRAPRPPPPSQRAAAVRPALNRPAPPAQRAAAIIHPAPPAQRAAAATVLPQRHFAPAARRLAWSRRASSAVEMTAAITISKGAGADAGLVESDTDTDSDYYDGDTLGLPIRAYASDSDDNDNVHASNGSKHVARFGAFSDDEDDDCVSCVGTGSLGADDVDGNGDDLEDDEEGYIEDDQEDEESYSGDSQEDEEGYDEDGEECNGDDLEDEEGYSEDGLKDEEGDEEYISEELLDNGEATANMEEFEYLGHGEVVLDDGEDVLAQDDWYVEEVDCGCDQEEEMEFEEFYLL